MLALVHRTLLGVLLWAVVGPHSAIASAEAPPPHPSHGQIEGRVLDAETVQPLANVTIQLVGTDLGTTTAPNGRFVLATVPGGAYSLRIGAVGYAEQTLPVEVVSGETVRVEVVLAPQESRLDEIVVEGRSASLVGIARAASQGQVGMAQIAPRPLLRVGEVLETVPGLIVTQHSGSGKANQFFLRGFNLDHGTDFAGFVEGVPMNLPTHAHGQGWLDLNFLIPELIESVQYGKGPYDPASGNFSSAGTARIDLVRSLDQSLVKTVGGTDRYAEALAAVSTEIGSGDLLLAAKGRYYDGPWVNPEGGTLFSGVAKYSTGTRRQGAEITAMAYHNDWDATDQVARRAVEDGSVSRLGTIDPSGGGTTDRLTLVGTVRQPVAGGRLEARAYAAAYRLNLFSNFTYFLDDPVQGDQFEQADRRVYGGASLRQTWDTPAVGLATRIDLGADLRHDEILGVGLFRTSERARVGTIRDDEVGETSLGVFARGETNWTTWLRTSAGLRVDGFRFDVRAGRDENAGVETDAILSPTLGLALGPWSGTEVYANAGLGYHSNDARGTTITVDPASGDPVDAVDPLVRTRGAELGLRTTALPGVQSTIALWAIGLDSELVFVGDAGGTEASDASRHVGIEWDTYVTPADGVGLHLDIALTDSRYLDVPADAERIENSISEIVTGGVYLGRERGPQGSLQLRHFGPRPLTGDGSVRSDATTLVNARLGYDFERVRVGLDVLNLLDSEAADVSYYYASRLTGEPAEGVEDVHFHPVIPRSVRLGATVRF